MREYKNKVETEIPAHITGKLREEYEEFWEPDYVMTVEQWELEKDYLWDQGDGYWVKDGLMSRDDAHTTPQEDATHVIWYNK